MSTLAETPSPAARQKPQSKFERLWKNAEKLAHENLDLEDQLDTLVLRMREELFPLEIQLGEAIRVLVHRQLDFAAKKSLLKWQRAELNDWLDVNLSELASLGLLDDVLHDRIAEQRANELDIDLDPDSDLSSAEQLDAYFERDAELEREMYAEIRKTQGGATDTEFDLDEDPLEAFMRKVRGEFEESLGPGATADLFGASDEETLESPHDGEHHSANTHTAIDDSVFKRIFRQTAAALHPDKVTDETLKQQHHELMSQLLLARKESDLITLIRLHEAHTSGPSELSSLDEKALENTLENYLYEQSEKRESIIFKSSLHHEAFDEYYGRKPASITRKINAHKKAILKSRDNLMSLTTELKTLKRLKEILSERYDDMCDF